MSNHSIAPYGAPVAIENYTRAEIHPFIGRLCVTFMSNVVPMLARSGQRKRTHRDLAARAFFQGAYELSMLHNGGTMRTKTSGEIDEFSVSGALALFVGGTMIRGGFFKTVEAYANVWSKTND